MRNAKGKLATEKLNESQESWLRKVKRKLAQAKLAQGKLKKSLRKA